MSTKNKITLSALLVFAPAFAHAEVSANLGWASDYFYRGILQAPSSASAGLDFERNGFYAGTWAADVKDGLEVDGFFGYAAEIRDITWSVGFTGYYYTGDFDDAYEEMNFGLGYGWATLDVAVGEYDNFGDGALDYTWYALTIANEGFYGKLAGFARDFDGEYLELGYGASLAELDIGIAAIFADSELAGHSGEALVFTIGKTFDVH
jgi:uncharacterized protein (TIGR02001 family)